MIFVASSRFYVFQSSRLSTTRTERNSIAKPWKWSKLTVYRAIRNDLFAQCDELRLFFPLLIQNFIFTFFFVRCTSDRHVFSSRTKHHHYDNVKKHGGIKISNEICFLMRLKGRTKFHVQFLFSIDENQKICGQSKHTVSFLITTT